LPNILKEAALQNNPEMQFFLLACFLYDTIPRIDMILSCAASAMFERRF
jgi:hypothetical protein